MNPVLDIKNLTIRFGDKTVIDRLSLSLMSGQKASLSGPSGAGKSTLLKAILGFVIPQSGTIQVKGTLMSANTIWKLRRELAYVPQEPEMEAGRVREVIARPFQFQANQSLKSNLNNIPELFDRFLLTSDLLDKDITQLSGGEKQRVTLIMSILLNRKIFLLDEVTSALDADSKKAVKTWFDEQSNVTVLAISHDPEGFYYPDHLIPLKGNHQE